MATLPDLDTSQIGVIAFWNAHDYRVTSGAVIDPTDVLGILDEYTLYDNGVDGKYTKGDRQVNVRVKNDGWLIAWFDRTNWFALDIPASDWVYVGYYDLLDWKTTGSVTPDTNTLIEVIADMYNQLSNSADFAFVRSEVGVYCYEFSDISTISFAKSTMTSGIVDTYLKFTVTSGTYLRYLVVMGYALNAVTGVGTLRSYVQYEYDGTYLADSPEHGISKAGTYDLLGNNAFSYDTELSLHGFRDVNRDDLNVSMGMVAMWK